MFENNFREQLPKHAEIKDHLQTLWRRKWIVLLCLAMAATAAVFYNRLSTPVYEAVTAIIYEEPQINILNSEAGRPAIDRSAIINLTEQLKSRALAEELARALPKQIIQALKAAGHPSANHSQEDFVGIDRELGLSDVLRNQCVSIEKAAMTWAVQMRHNANFFVFPCGTLPPNPYELLNTPRMREVLAEFKRRYDLVILDSPPLMAVTDSVVVGNEVDAVCLVIKSGKTSRDEASRAQKLLEDAQTNIIGTILNGIDVKKNGNGYYKSDYYLN